METKPSTAQQASDYELHKHEYDATSFVNDPFRQTEEMDWGTIVVWTPSELRYVGKELQIKSQKNVPVNISDRFRIVVLRDGQANILIEDTDGQMHTAKMEYASAFRIHPGQKYGFEPSEDTRIIEGSERNPNSDVDRSKFVAEAYVAVDDSKPWGNEPIFSKKGDPIAMKILHLEQDGWLSLQAHAVKVESYYMSYGECDMVMENSNRELDEFPLKFDVGYTTKVGQRHRHKGKTRMDVFEVSTPEDGSTTWRIEDKYARGDQTDEVRRQERGDI